MGDFTENTLLDILESEGVSSLAAGGLTTNYTRSIPIPKKRDFGLEILFDSSGGVDVKVELEVGNDRPAVESLADAAYSVVQALSAGIVDENVHFIALVPIVAKFMRIKFTGQGANHASTKCVKLRIALSES